MGSLVDNRSALLVGALRTTSTFIQSFITSLFVVIAESDISDAVRIYAIRPSWALLHCVIVVVRIILSARFTTRLGESQDTFCILRSLILFIQLSLRLLLCTVIIEIIVQKVSLCKAEFFLVLLVNARDFWEEACAWRQI